ncbi:MAG: hypothetical protein ACKVGT_00610 [Flavobacteriales bacterium]|tara:strand:- start:9274 stop:9444 length:171 start_codon:yes stop_codon:yes gene_type:complete
MAKKGKAKNTKNKAKHARLMDQKFDKKRKEKDTRAEKLKAIIKKSKAQKEGENDEA